MKKHQQNSTDSTAEITPKQAQVIRAVISGASVTDATKQADIDRTTFYLWQRSDASFEAELNRAKQEQRDATRAELRELVVPAISTMRELLTASGVPAAVRLKTALSILQSVGTLEPETIGKIDPTAIEQERMLGIVEIR